MTTFQDPQPQSRRAVRQSERGEAPETPAPFSEQAPAAPQFYSDAAAPHDMWDTTARRAAQLPSATQRTDAPAAPSGRRAAAPAAPATPVAEPLTYSTQQKPAVPSYDGPSFRARPTPETPAQESEALPPTQMLPKVEQPSYRVRDYSPEGRRSAPAFDQGWSAKPATPPTDLDYHTEAGSALVSPPPAAPIAEVPASVAPVAVPAPAAEKPHVVSQVPADHTLTRRQLRAMQQAGQVPETAVAPEATTPAAVETPAEAPVAHAAEALAAEAPAPAPQAPVETPEAQAPAAQLSPFDALFQPQAPAELVEPPLAPSPFRAPEPIATPALQDAVSEYDALVAKEEPAAAPAVDPASPESFSWSPPVGHWSTQADLDDELPENTISRRTIGSGTTATSALVLPSTPLGNDIRGPLTGTGEIMLTGSIDLPHSFAATGQSDRFDNDGMDALFDLSDAEVISTDSSPVRAIRAVSTHSSGHGVTHTQKPKGTRALTVLLITACSLAVVVAGVLIAAFATNVF